MSPQRPTRPPRTAASASPRGPRPALYASLYPKLRLLLGGALLGTCLALPAADPPRPAAAAASALRSIFEEAARPATDAASAVRNAVKQTPRPADVAASAAQAAEKAVLDSLRPPAVAGSGPAAQSGAASSGPSTSATPSAQAAPTTAVSSPVAQPGTVVSTPAACLRAPDQPATCAPGAGAMSLTTIGLNAARIGQPYKTKPLVTGGKAPYLFEVTEGKLPEGLAFTADSLLSGKPTGPAALHRFTVRITDASSPPLTLRQAYAMRVVDVQPPAKPASAPAPEREPVPEPAREAQIVSYMLLQEDLDDLFKKAEAPDAAASEPKADAKPRRRVRAPGPAVPVAHADKMHAMLKPMLNIDFPTEKLFRAALEARRCAYYGSLVTAAGDGKASQDELNCPPPPAKPDSAAAKLPPTLYADLLPDTVKDDLTLQARWPHLLREAKPVDWSPSEGCGCTAADSQEVTYGLFPFWQARADEAQQIKFSLFSRIGVLGVQLTDTGELVAAWQEEDEQSRISAPARRHGTQVDLVVHRAEWSHIVGRADLDALVQRSVRNIIDAVDAPLTDWASRLKHTLLPFSDEPRHLFDGVTLFFDNVPTDPVGRKAFGAFHRSMVTQLIAAMQKTGRPYALNIVVPFELLGQHDAYDFESLEGYLRQAHRPNHPRNPEGNERVDYKGSTDLTISYLVLLPESTRLTKKELRERLDRTEVVQGHRRVALLNALVPVVMHSGGEPDAPKNAVQDDRLDLDLAYFKWQFGGVGFWPLPLASADNGQRVGEVLRENYEVRRSTQVSAVCNVVCPNRSAVRLLLLALIVVGAISIALYTWSCRVRRIGRPFVLFLWVCGIATLVVAGALLTCDPQLTQVRKGNLPLVLLLVVAIAMGMYYSLKPKVTPP
jgi:hypothetical protein